MKWFEGSIPAAIQDSRTRKAIFVVYVTGMNKNYVKFISCRPFLHPSLWHEIARLYPK